MIHNRSLNTNTGTTTGKVRKVKMAEGEKEIVLPEELENMINEAKAFLNPVQFENLRKLIYRFKHIFTLKGQALGRTDIVLHDIDTGDSRPIRNRVRNTPIHLRADALKEEHKMKDLGVIEPSDSPWASPVVLVRKKDGSLRYCIDYRRLNEVTKKDSFPLPNMQTCLDSLGKAKVFSTMDLASGYWQVGLSEDAQEKSSFYGVSGGLWKFKVMPFGLCNAPATFERLMERILGSLQWQIALCYIDDVLCFSSSVQNHLQDLEAIFVRLEKAGLTLKPKKCHFFRKRVEFLGHVVSEEGIETDPAKVDKVLKCPRPKNIHEVRSAVGLFSYYRRFMPDFSEIAKPLVTLTEKDRPFVWEDAQEDAFLKLKELLTKAPVLSYPLAEGQFILDTDASQVGIGAVLSQMQDGEEKVIAYGSRALSKSEQNYCTTRREMLSVVHFTKQYQHFLLGRPFKLRTDNSAVRYMRSMKYEPVSHHVARWQEKLENFDFVIEHRPGRLHQNADSLSRPPFVQCQQCLLRHYGALMSKKGPPKMAERKASRGDNQAKAMTTKSPTQSSRPVVGQHHDGEDKRAVSMTSSQRAAGQHHDRRKSVGSAVTTSATKQASRKSGPGGTHRRVRGMTTTGPVSDTSTPNDTKEKDTEYDSNLTNCNKDANVSLRPHPRYLHHCEVIPEGTRLGEEGGSHCGWKHVSGSKKSFLQPVRTGRLRKPRGKNAQSTPRTSWIEDGVKLGKNLIREEQWKDPACVDALIWLQRKERPNKKDIRPMGAFHKFLWATFDSLEDQHGLLVRKISPELSGKEQVVTIVPESLRRECISKCHDLPTSGHFYYWKTLRLVKKHFLWPGMSQDVQNYCRSCHVCATKKKAGRKMRAPMKHYEVGLPLEEICIDLAGPFPISDTENRYCLIIVDSFSKWMEAYPIKNMEAKTVAETLMQEFVSRFGLPFWIKSDQGRQFESELFQELCNIMEVEHKTSTAFHPQGNSRVERMVKVVTNLLSAFCQSQKTWDKNLPLLTLAYRSTVHEVTGYTPNYLMMGREINLPLDIMVGTLPDGQKQIAPQYIAEMKERLQDAFQQVRDNLKTYAERNKKYYDLRTHGDEHKVGDLVYVMKKTRKIGVSPKLDAKWNGPYIVLKTFGTIYEVQINRKTSKLYHFDLIKPCHADIQSVSPWLKSVRRKLPKS
jgi:hypothetical protein